MVRAKPATTKAAEAFEDQPSNEKKGSAKSIGIKKASAQAIARKRRGRPPKPASSAQEQTNTGTEISHDDTLASLAPKKRKYKHTKKPSMKFEEPIQVLNDPIFGLNNEGLIIGHPSTEAQFDGEFTEMLHLQVEENPEQIYQAEGDDDEEEHYKDDEEEKYSSSTHRNMAGGQNTRVPGGRRKRVAWSESEVLALRKGIHKHGVGNWALILNDSELSFHPTRNSVDLKDKYRNLEFYKPYAVRSLRKYVLLNENHEVLRRTYLPDPSLDRDEEHGGATSGGGSGSNGGGIRIGGPHIYVNRYPRDAALKVASRSEFYPDAQSTGPIHIYLREVGRLDGEPLVHVYSGTRRREIAPVDVVKFSGRGTIWQPEVKKLRIEKMSAGKNALVYQLPEFLDETLIDAGSIEHTEKTDILDLKAEEDLEEDGEAEMDE